MSKFLVIITFLSLALVSCKEKSKAELTAERALKAYLDCNLTEMESLASSEVVEQVRWRISNLTQAERELLQENIPTVSAENTEQEDAVCKIAVSANNALILDSIGQTGRIEDCRFLLELTRNGNKWKVTTINMLTDKQ